MSTLSCKFTTNNKVFWESLVTPINISGTCTKKKIKSQQNFHFNFCFIISYSTKILIIHIFKKEINFALSVLSFSFYAHYFLDHFDGRVTLWCRIISKEKQLKEKVKKRRKERVREKQRERDSLTRRVRIVCVCVWAPQYNAVVCQCSAIARPQILVICKRKGGVFNFFLYADNINVPFTGQESVIRRWPLIQIYQKLNAWRQIW